MKQFHCMLFDYKFFFINEQKNMYFTYFVVCTNLSIELIIKYRIKKL